MMMYLEKKTENKALWIFPNFLEAINELPDRQRADVWRAICEYGLGQEISIEKLKPLQKSVIKMLIPLLKLRNTGGSLKKGDVINPQGKNQFNRVSNCKIKKQEDNPLDNPSDNPSDNPLYNKNRNKNRNKKENNLSSFGELGFVLLFQEQYDKLAEQYTEAKLKFAIEKLDTWLGKNPKKQAKMSYIAYFKANSWVWEGYKEPYVDEFMQRCYELEEAKNGRKV